MSKATLSRDGDVPPPLVGASATLVEPFQHGLAKGGAKVYLFGGRLVSSRRMVNTLYLLDLDEMKWSRLTPTSKPKLGSTEPAASASSEQPQPRYFHSADLWRDKIIFFGGMGYSQGAQDPNTGAPSEELCVLDELLAFDLATQQWDYSFDVASHNLASSSSHTEATQPAPRYAHLSSLSGNTLSIIGGQNLANQYVESINLFSLSQNRWIGAQRFRKQCGSYRSLAVGAKCLYKDGEKAKCYPRAKDPLVGADANGTSGASAPNGHSAANQGDKVEQNPLPMSCRSEPNQPLPVYLYSNYNFTDVRRELEVLTVQGQADTAGSSGADKPQQRARSDSIASQESALDVDGPLTPSQAAAAPSSSGPFVSMEDRSNHMGGVTLPPGLRFPTGALLGPYLLISGTYLANATQSFSIWALHLPTMVWSRIEPGSALSTGSWNRALLWPSKNRLVVVGHKERDLVSDYNHRQTNWDHVVVLELEAWGIYQPPTSVLSEAAVQLGLDKLAATAPSAMASAQALARGVGGLNSAAGGASTDEQSNLEQEIEALNLGGRGDFEIISEPSPVVLALLQFVYTLRICTALQRHPAVVCALMVLARTYQLDNLASWARHAAHVALADDLNPKASSASARQGDTLSPSSSVTHAFDSSETSGLDLFRPSESLGLHPEERHRLAVCLYEAASLCGCEGLQIRALRVVMAIARWLQKHGAGPTSGGGSGASLDKQGQGRGEGPSRDRSGSSSHYGASGNGAAPSTAGQFRAGSGSTFRTATGGILSAGPSPLLQMPSPVPSMSRAGSDTASSHGPLTPNSVYQSFLDRRGESFSSSIDAPPSGSALAYLSEVESLDDEAGPDFRKLPTSQGFSSSRMDKSALVTASPDLVNLGTGTMSATTMASAGSDLEPSQTQTATSTRKRFSLFGRNATSDSPSLSDASTMEPTRVGSSLGFHGGSPSDEASTTLLDRRASASAHVGASSSQLAPSLLSNDDWSSRFHLPRHSMAARSETGGSAVSSALNSPALTMDPKRRHLHASAASSPASEQFPVNSYGPRSEQEYVSRSASQHSLSSDASAGIELSKDVTHLSPKEIAKLEKEERKRIEKEEKQRKKAEKAEYKRLAAEAVFGPKGSAGPSPALPSSDFAMYASGTQTTDGEGSGAVSSRRSSEPADSRSSTSTASPRTGSSVRTVYSSRTPAPIAPVRKGEWAVTTATGGGPWFSAPPPMMAPPSLRSMPKGNRSVASLSGRSSAKTRLTS
ncbi:hypothetical protein [Sporisorium scitamineum]|uniref:Uncharacterized protein n=1 Tax=Sporisorium scitamineum TaxID=49012 RepID=A0A0F7S5V0_9BASI|nr:hypothetical protein [Sporisorium scitamineum]